MTPSVRISGLTPGANDRIVSVEVTDNEGFKSDTATITLDDRDGILALPEKGKTFSVQMGYLETGLQLMGIYTVNDVSASGYPMKLKVQGKAADMGQSKLKQPHTKHHENKTIKQIVTDAAGRAGLTPVVGGDVGSFRYKSIGQNEESDMNFLSRLAKEHDSVFSIKNGRMVFMPKSGGISASGIELPNVLIRGPGAFAGLSAAFGIVPGDVIEFDCTLPDRPKFSKIKNTWFDPEDSKVEVAEGESGQNGPDFYDRHHAPNRDEAEARAKSRGKSMQRGQGSLRLEVVGDASLRAELLAQVTGIRSGVDGLWRVKTATHKIENSYTTSLDCELPGSKGNSKGGDGGDDGDAGGAGGADSGGYVVPYTPGDQGSPSAAP